jgi:transposase
MSTPPRYIGLDIHRQFVMIAAVDEHQQVLFNGTRVSLDTFAAWAQIQLRATDHVALESTTNAWAVYDVVEPLVADVRVADAHKLSLISRSPHKTDQHDALVLAKLLAAKLIPTVWVPPDAVRELRNLIAHRRQLVRDRTAAKNRLHSILHRHNLHLPTGEPFSQANQAWWQALTVSSTDRLRVRHDLLHIEHLSTLIDEVEAEIAQLSVQDPWYDQLAFVIQISGLGLLSGMTVLSAIGDITRFPSPRQLVGYSGLGSRVHASGNTYRTGRITKQGRRELRTVLVEAAWSAVRYSPYWKLRFERLKAQIGKQKAIVAIARKLLVVIWHVLTKREADRYADPQAVARALMKWASRQRTATALGMSRADFVWQQLDRLGLEQQLDRFHYSGKLYVRQPTTPPVVREAAGTA